MTRTEYAARRLLVASDLFGHKLDALIVSSLANIRYLTGFTGSNGLLLVSGEQAILYTDPRYKIQASEESTCRVTVVRGPLLPALAKSLRTGRIRLLAFETARLSFEAWQILKSNLPRSASLTPVHNLVENCRMIKSEEEIALIRRSVLTNSKAFAQSLRQIRPGVRESDLAAELDFRMRRFGAEKPAFETIVAAGERSASPHARPTSKTLSNNELVLIDVGASQDGYASDMTRMVFLGRPSEKVSRLYSAVLKAQLAAIAAVREGVTAQHVDRQARTVLQKEDLGEAFVHATGHGLGLEIHEAPRIARRVGTRLQAGMAITIEPGVYLQGFGGVRIEDTVVVTRNGCEVLTPTSKELIVL